MPYIKIKYVLQPTSENKNIIIYNKHKKVRYVVQAISGAHAGWSKTQLLAHNYARKFNSKSLSL